ncbi:MAG: 3-hydroxyisobutyryl-CoA hydrolase [Maritimibacter sp.]
MTDILIYKEGRAGRITLNRPAALNALTYQMCLDIEAALEAWRDDDEVALVVIDGAGDKAFCAGGDIQELYTTGRAQDFEYGRKFWADEYRMNAKLAAFPKPTVAFMHGFVMGGGVGVSGHCAHRIVCETSQVAMPEVGIGLVPDVGGTWLLAQAPGRTGDYLATTAARMTGPDAIFAGFADHYVPREYWLDLIATLEISGDTDRIKATAQTPPPSDLAAQQAEIDALFALAPTEVIAACDTKGTDFATSTLKALRRASPLAVHCTLANIARAKQAGTLTAALGFEYEFTYRAMEHGDFLEGIRAAIIDKDRTPAWKHANLADVTQNDIAQMLAPLGENALNLEGL